MLAIAPPPTGPHTAYDDNLVMSICRVCLPFHQEIVTNVHIFGEHSNNKNILCERWFPPYAS